MTINGDVANAKGCASVLVRECLSSWGMSDIPTRPRISVHVRIVDGRLQTDG